MNFRMTHRYFIDQDVVEFNEESPPDWLTSNAYNWWWIDHVLTLKIGESIESDFRKILRTE